MFGYKAYKYMYVSKSSLQLNVLLYFVMSLHALTLFFNALKCIDQFTISLLKICKPKNHFMLKRKRRHLTGLNYSKMAKLLHLCFINRCRPSLNFL